MWKIYKYLFYKLLSFFTTLNGKNDSPEFTAMLAVAALSFCNILTLVNIQDVFFPFFELPEISRGRFFIYSIPYTLIFYFAFIFNKKYERIIKEFKNESEDQSKSGNRYVILYITISLVFLILSFALMVLKNEEII